MQWTDTVAVKTKVGLLPEIPKIPIDKNMAAVVIGAALAGFAVTEVGRGGGVDSGSERSHRSSSGR